MCLLPPVFAGPEIPTGTAKKLSRSEEARITLTYAATFVDEKAEGKPLILSRPEAFFWGTSLLLEDFDCVPGFVWRLLFIFERALEIHLCKRVFRIKPEKL